MPANYTFVAGDNGTHVFTNGVTLKTAGSQTVTATDTVTSTITGTTGAITVTTAAINKLLVVASPSSITAGTTSVTVTAQDAFGNTITGYTGTVHFTSTDAQGILPANYTFVAGDNGTHTFSVTLKTAASQTVTATDTVTATITGTTNSVTVSPAAASKVVFGQQPTQTKAGVVIVPAITVRVEDSFGTW